VPVFFLFDLADVLSIDASRFSDKGLGSHNYQMFSTAEELQELRWQDIYSTGPIDMTKATARNVIAARNAEIVVPDILSLGYLKFIYCRSPAEHESLRHLLPMEVLAKYGARIVSSPRSTFFYREDTYLESARLEARSVLLSFSPDTRSLGPFALRVQFRSLSGDPLLQIDRPDFQVRTNSGGYKWRLDAPAPEYELQVYLGSALIYANHYVDLDADIPF
jgi:hypothetical protein